MVRIREAQGVRNSGVFWPDAAVARLYADLVAKQGLSRMVSAE
jgi:hypothetical protein